MHTQHLSCLACPQCHGALTVAEVAKGDGEKIEEGRLACATCAVDFPILRHIPRFVPLENYSSNFGLEWSLHARTQYDAYTGLNISERRFFEETKWPRDLAGEVLLEVGSGSGRFTVHAASTGAQVISIDYSGAVDANYQSNGHRENVLIVQGDIFALPVPPAVADRVLCIGVVQHTPDPRKAFESLLPFARPGGSVVIDVYRRHWTNYLALKPYLRPLTRRMDPARLYRVLSRYVRFMWPLCRLLRRIPKWGSKLNWALCVPDYSRLGLEGEVLKEWACLDAFDMLSPRYDSPMTRAEVRFWFAAAGLEDIEVQHGYNGVEGRGRKPREIAGMASPG